MIRTGKHSIQHTAPARLHRVEESKPGINKPHDRIVRQQGLLRRRKPARNDDSFHCVRLFQATTSPETIISFAKTVIAREDKGRPKQAQSFAFAQLHRVAGNKTGSRMMKLEYEHFSSWAGGVLPMKSGGRWLPKEERLSREGIISPRHPSANGYPKGGDIRLLTANIEYRITNKKHKSINSYTAGIAHPVSDIQYRVSGIEHPVSSDQDLRTTATSEHPSERTNSNDKQDKLAAHNLWLAANSCLLPFGETERGLLTANIEYRITNKKHKSIYSRPAIAYSATARLHRVVSKPGINKPHDRIVRQQARILTDDLRSTATNEHSSGRTNINDKQNKLAAHSLWLAAKNSKPIFLAKGNRTVANIKNHHAYAT